MIETELDTIARILDEYRIRESGHIAKKVHEALIQRRLIMLADIKIGPHQ